MNSAIFKTVFLGCLLICPCCARLPKSFDFLKSPEQIKVEEAQDKLKDDQTNYNNSDFPGQLANVSSQVTPGSQTTITNDIVAYRQALVHEREAYWRTLWDQYDLRQAILEKKTKDAGYFALGTKAAAIASGIASAILVAASSANVAYVAGLAAFGTGAAAFQSTAENVGYAVIVGQGEAQALNEAASNANNAFKDVSWSHLYDYAQYATQTDWNSCMQKLGSAIVQLEAAIRFTKYEIKPTTQPALAPGAPTGVSADPGQGQATVRFIAPASNGSDITSYKVTSNPESITASGPASPITVKGLTGGPYTFTVTATNGVGTGPASVASAPLAIQPALAPGAPTGVLADPGQGQATVRFIAPASNGSDITSYKVTSNPESITASGPASPITVKGLTGGPYTFTVTATNGVGTGPASVASPAVPVKTVP